MKNTSTVEYVSSNTVHEVYPEITFPIPGTSEIVNEALPQGEVQMFTEPLKEPIFIFTCIWILGIAVMLSSSVISYCKLRKKLIGVLHLKGNIYIADHISSSF